MTWPLRRCRSVVCALTVSASLVLGGCSSDSARTETSTSPSTVAPASTAADSTSSTLPSTTAVASDRPSTSVDPGGTSAPRPDDDEDLGLAAFAVAFGWLATASPDEATFERSVSGQFRRAISYSDFVAALAQLRQRGPWTLAGDPVSDGTGHVKGTATDGAGTRFTIGVATTSATDPSMATLFFQVEPPESVDAAIRTLRSQGTLRLLTADVVDDTCVPSLDVDSETPMPIGSMFKLYVLGAIVDAAARGEIQWDQSVLIRDELDSIPSGTTQDEPAGTELSVHELAVRMISISDNTATDHLIDLVGRDAVEAAQLAYGHHDPSLNAPFLTTREAAIIKLSGSDLSNRYITATPAQRRALLATEVATAALPSLAAITSAAPLAVNEVEWFASPADLCRALVALDRSPEAGEILAVNPGVASDNPDVARIGFKGGSEPGVLASGWIVETRAGRRAVAVGGVTNETEAVDELVAVAMLAGVRDLQILADEPPRR